MGNINDFINQLIAMFGNLETLISAASGAVIAAIVLYQKINKMLAEKSLAAIVSPIAAEAENKPMQVLNTIVNKPLAMDSTAQAVSQTAINSNDGKQLIVAAAAYEATKATKPKILRKLGIKSVNDMLPFVSLIYQGVVKPIIKRH